MKRPKLLFLFLLLVATGVHAQTREATRQEQSVPKHILSPGDMVKVSILNEADLSDSFRIQIDGNIRHPLLGAVKIKGKTVEEATDVFREALKKYLYDPKVTITVTEYAPKTFTIMGQVRSPGKYEYPGDQTLNIMEAIARAGGATEWAKKNQIVIKRVVGDSVKTININVKDLEEGSDEVKIPLLQDRDIIIINESTFRL